MAVVDPTITSLLKIPIPGENSEPFFDQFTEYTRVLEDAIFYRKLFANMLMSGGGTRIWSAGSSLFTWSADFVIPVFHWGRQIIVEFGPDGSTRNANVPDGSCLVVDIPASMNSNQTRNFRVVSQLNVNANNEWVAGWNNSGTLQLRIAAEFT